MILQQCEATLNTAVCRIAASLQSKFLIVFLLASGSNMTDRQQKRKAHYFYFHSSQQPPLPLLTSRRDWNPDLTGCAGCLSIRCSSLSTYAHPCATTP